MNKLIDHKSRSVGKGKRHDSSGFTLVETLIAVAVLMIAIAGPLVIAEKSLLSATYAKNQLMATYLAQDAMESIKNQVDTNEVNFNTDGNDWLSSGTASFLSCTSDNPCAINTAPGQHDALSQPSNCDVQYEPVASYAGVTTGSEDAATFSRCFYLKQANTNNATHGGDTLVDAVVEVDWPGDVGGGGGIRIEDTLFNVFQ